jgi:uncharacterized lipoprotein YmbA
MRIKAVSMLPEFCNRASRTVLAMILAASFTGCTVFPESSSASLYAIDLPISTGLYQCPVKFTLREVQLPGYLDRSEIVLIRSDTQIDVSAQHLWAAPISKEMTRVAAQGIAERLIGSQSYPYPVRLQERPEWVFTITVSRLSSQANSLSVDFKLKGQRLEKSIVASQPSEQTIQLSSSVSVSFGVAEPGGGSIASRAKASAKGLQSALEQAVTELSKGLAQELCLTNAR